MGNKIVTEADRKATPRPVPPNGFTLPTGGRGQRVSLERGVATRSKKNPGKRPSRVVDSRLRLPHEKALIEGLSHFWAVPWGSAQDG